MFNQISIWLLNRGVTEFWTNVVVESSKLIIVFILAIVVYYIAKRILLSQVEKIVFRSTVKWDDVFLNRKVFRKASLLFPGLVVLGLSEIFTYINTEIAKGSLFYLIFILTLVILSILDGINEIYEGYEISKERPIKGYLQIIKILIFSVAVILAISILMGKSPFVLIGGLSALTAVLLLVFKDTLLGFIASIQFTMNDMVRIGDWIEMPKYGADGDVIDITVNTVKVQNWDKTITTIPTYMLVSDSFKNWRGMDEAGGRRIKRSIHIDVTSVRFLKQVDIDNLKKILILINYLSEKELVMKKSNEDLKIESSEDINSRKLTNIGTFRAYILNYLRQHPQIKKEMTLLVRQLSPTEVGIPIEIYAFSADQDWIRYEAIQSDIFDHLFAMLSAFDLRPYQLPGKNINSTFTNGLQFEG